MCIQKQLIGISAIISILNLTAIIHVVEMKHVLRIYEPQFCQLIFMGVKLGRLQLGKNLGV
jgi:hypothetical protein